MTQPLRESADLLAKLLASQIDLRSMLSGLDIVIETEPNLLVSALQTMDVDTTKNMLVLAMITVILTKMEEVSEEAKP